MAENVNSYLPKRLKALRLPEDQAGMLYVLWEYSTNFDNWIPSLDAKYMVVRDAKHMLGSDLEQYDPGVRRAFLEDLRDEARGANKIMIVAQLNEWLGETEVLSFEQIFKFKGDWELVKYAVEEPYKPNVRAVENGEWVYSGPGRNGVIYALADVLDKKREYLSIDKGLSADDIAKIIANHYGIELGRDPWRARWHRGQKNLGHAFRYMEWHGHFSAKI